MKDAILATRQAEPATALAAALEPLGWVVERIDLDLPGGRARMEVTAGSLAVTLDAQNGRTTITREARHYNERARSGLRYTGGWDVELLGRTHHEGIRSALRTLADYVQENAPHPRALSARTAFRALLNGVPA